MWLIGIRANSHLLRTDCCMELLQLNNTGVCTQLIKGGNAKRYSANARKIYGIAMSQFKFSFQHAEGEIYSDEMKHSVISTNRIKQ
jgi:hypothetical protein